MTTSNPRPDPSGRYSARSSPANPATPVNPAPSHLSAPESLARSSGETRPPAASERGARAAGPRRLSDTQLQRLNAGLSDRDQAVLRSVATYRFLTTTQVRAFHFTDHATEEAAARVCRRVLLRLRRLGVIEELDRRVGGIRAGSDAFVWRVGGLGDRLLRLDAGHGARARRKEPSERFLDHCLDIASTHLTLLAASRHRDLDLLDIATEPHSWRPYLGTSGEHLTLKPDLLATTASGEFEDSWAFEIDEGSESIPTLLTKCRQYEAYRATGREQADGGVFPIVVWIVPSERRAARLNDALDRSPRLDRTLYRICTPDRLLDLVRGGAA